MMFPRYIFFQILFFSIWIYRDPAGEERCLARSCKTVSSRVKLRTGILSSGHRLNNLCKQLVLTTRLKTRPQNLVLKTRPSKLSVVDVALPIDSVSQLPFKSERPDQHFETRHAHRFPEEPQVITSKGHNKH
jgi:hypothetical protein